MPSPQKAKGSSFEREIATFLTKTYNESFIRAPGSGAYVGGKNQSRKEFLHEGQIRSFKGDIVPGESFTKFNAECKSYADFPFHLLMTGEWIIMEHEHFFRLNKDLLKLYSGSTDTKSDEILTINTSAT